jgi:excisionase family DNA binding protein
MIGSARNPFKPAPIQPITVRIPMAVKMTGIGRSKLYELISAGEITAIKVGSSRLVIVESLKDFVERQRA